MKPNLTVHQETVLGQILQLLRDGETRIVLKGSAGTGKTFLSSRLSELLLGLTDLIRTYNNGAVYATAPTNKALAVLQGKIQVPRITFKTIHSACSLYQHIDAKTGAATFIRARKGKLKGDSFEFSRAAIIDESSMLNSDFLGKVKMVDGYEEYVRGYLEDFRFPIIFIGDAKQLNPVGEEVSPVWTKGFKEVELTEIIRQGAGNPIIDLSRDLDLIPFKRPALVDGKGYMYSEDRRKFVEDLAAVNGTDELKYLAYTNKDVDAMNQVVRERRYGKPRRIEKEETIVFNTPLGSFYTNQEVRVDEMEIVTSDIYIPTEKTKYDENNDPYGDMDKIRIKYYVVNNSFKVVHELSDTLYTSIYKTLKANNRELGWDGRGYHYFANQFADIKYNHGLTIHKSQGSTYKTAIVNIGNIMWNRNAVERQRMLYTAITRASDLVILNNVR